MPDNGSLGFTPQHHGMKAEDGIRHAMAAARPVKPATGVDSKMSYPPGSPEWKKAGSPRSTKTGESLPTNTVLSPSEGGPEGIKADLVSPNVSEERNEFTSKKIGTSPGGMDTYQMQDKTGQTGTPQKFASTLPPSEEADPGSPSYKQSSADIYRSEADKMTSMSNEVSDIQKKNLSDVMKKPNENIAVKGGMSNKNYTNPEAR